MAILLGSETTRRLNEDDRRWRLKLGLRAFATFWAVPSLILFAAATSLSKQDYGGNDWVDAMPLAPVLLALLYNPTHILLLTSRTHHRSIHPAWPLTLDLLIWALSLPALVFSVGDGWFWYWQPVELSIDGDFVLCDFALNFWSEPCNPMIYTLGRVEIAANVFLALILIAHFILFVYDCIATHRWRKARAGAGGGQGGRRNIELQYHRDPEDHMSGAPAAPPAYTPSSAASHPGSTTVHHNHHQAGASISKPAQVAGRESDEGYSSPSREHFKPSPPPTTTSVHAQGEGGVDEPREQFAFTRSQEQAPQLSPVSPVNSGSGGGFGASFGQGFMSGGEAGQREGPFGDHQGAVRYA